MNLEPWRETFDQPQQFNSESLYPELKEFVTESPTRPSFSYSPAETEEEVQDDQLQFVTGDQNILNIIRKPTIGKYTRI